jgi:N-acetyl-anhydromuramyl-L-alanine amidase AmpD
MLATLSLAVMLQLAAVEPKIKKNFLPGKVPRDTTKNYVVIHNDGGNLNASATRLVLRARKLAYHYFIQTDGSIFQFMDLRHSAKHAGDSRWGGMFGWNGFSIAIALQGTNSTNYSCKQYESLKNLLSYIRLRYPDNVEKPILGHSDIAWPRGRKHDPGKNFDLRNIEHDSTCIT